MYELIILGFLMRRPMHGYLIAKIINDMFGPYARLSNGRFYPLLSKLVEQGLIVADASSDAPAPTPAGHDRRQRTFHISAAGRQRFHQLMMDTTSNPGEYRTLFWLKVSFARFVSAAEYRYLLDHYLTYSQAHIFHITNEMEDLKRTVAPAGLVSGEDLEQTLLVMRHNRRQWQCEVEDAQQMRLCSAQGEADPRAPVWQSAFSDPTDSPNDVPTDSLQSPSSSVPSRHE